MIKSIIEKLFPSSKRKKEEQKYWDGLDRLMTNDEQNLTYASGANGEATMDDFADFLEGLRKHPDYKQDFEDHDRFMKQIYPYIHMTKEEMIEAIPDGWYDISCGKWRAHTGKMGFINLIITYRDYGKI